MKRLNKRFHEGLRCFAVAGLPRKKSCPDQANLQQGVRNIRSTSGIGFHKGSMLLGGSTPKTFSSGVTGDFA
jgi:hypothetical protein